MRVSDLPLFLTTERYAELTYSNLNVVRNKCKAGSIPAIHRNGKWLIPTERVFDLDARTEADICAM